MDRNTCLSNNWGLSVSRFNPAAFVKNFLNGPFTPIEPVKEGGIKAIVT